MRSFFSGVRIIFLTAILPLVNQENICNPMSWRNAETKLQEALLFFTPLLDPDVKLGNEDESIGRHWMSCGFQELAEIT